MDVRQIATRHFLNLCPSACTCRTLVSAALCVRAATLQSRRGGVWRQHASRWWPVLRQQVQQRVLMKQVPVPKAEDVLAVSVNCSQERRAWDARLKGPSLSTSKLGG